MTTLQELVDEFMDVLEETTIDGGYTIPKIDGDSWLNRDDAENRLISFIEKSYLAGKEDEKRRIREYFANLPIGTPIPKNSPKDFVLSELDNNL
jgi:hypothetical protein